jgi:hypothetical protein
MLPHNKLTGRLWIFHKVFGGSDATVPRRSVRSLGDSTSWWR